MLECPTDQKGEASSRIGVPEPLEPFTSSGFYTLYTINRILRMHARRTNIDGIRPGVFDMLDEVTVQE